MLCCFGYALSKKNKVKSHKIRKGDKIHVFENKKILTTVVVGEPTETKKYNTNNYVCK
jgi:hypothetical protein